ncbi:hypothetical protein L249_4850, partial [Ophiocordyceps polyrhachis-furcata BCC 54312]
MEREMGKHSILDEAEAGSVWFFLATDSQPPVSWDSRRGRASGISPLKLWTCFYGVEAGWAFRVAEMTSYRCAHDASRARTLTGLPAVVS